ncbi:MAG: FG-GAP-like repeat-containing protein [Pyrinomonadaceae bacterium]
MLNSAKFLNKIKLTVIALSVVIGLTGYYTSSSDTFRATANVSGPPSSHTGAPGETSCIECHTSFSLNSGGGAVFVSGLPANYTPGASYPVTVTVNQQNAVRFGFQTVALDKQNVQAGNYTVTGGSGAPMQIVNGSVGGATRRYVEHTINGVTPTQFDTKSWTFTWLAPTTRKGKVTFYAAGNGANSDSTTSGDYIYTGSTSVCSGSVQSNFDSDSKADIAVFRPSTGAWYRLNSSNGQFNAVQFGANGDKIVPGDFDGDGKSDVAVFRPSNNVWYILRSSDNGFISYQFGASGDIPVVGDFTGDGKSDLAVFRPSTGSWYTLNLVNNAFAAAQYGANGDKPVSGDFDGDGKFDYAVYRPSTGVWYVLRSSNSTSTGVQFGIATDRAVPGDYDGDGKTDYAVFRQSTGYWYLQQSTAGFSSIQFGATGDQPAPTDYDGDCKTDVAVYRAGNWYILNSGDSSVSAVPFGLSTDIAVPSAFATP